MAVPPGGHGLVAGGHGGCAGGHGGGHGGAGRLDSGIFDALTDPVSEAMASVENSGRSGTRLKGKFTHGRGRVQASTS